MARAATKTSSRAKPVQDFAEHERTYRGFLQVTKWSVIAAAIVLVILYFIVIH